MVVEDVNILEGLAKTRHPAAKAVTQTPAKQGVTKKRSCNAGKPMCMRTSEGEDASLHKEASILASLRNGPTKKQRPPHLRNIQRDEPWAGRSRPNSSRAALAHPGIEQRTVCAS